MKTIAVESTTLATVAYDVERAILELEFCDRSVYRYFGVPKDVHFALDGYPLDSGDPNR
jgi:KTSC domain